MSRPKAVVASEARPEAVLGARRLLQKPSWAPGGPSRGRLGRQEARPEAVLGARRPVLGRPEAFLGVSRPVQKPSWASGGPSRGRLGVVGPSKGRLRRQEARLEAVLGVSEPVQRPSGPPGGQKRWFCRQFERNRRFCGHVGRGGPECQVPTALSLTGQLLYRY